MAITSILTRERLKRSLYPFYYSSHIILFLNKLNTLKHRAYSDPKSTFQRSILQKQADAQKSNELVKLLSISGVEFTTTTEAYKLLKSICGSKHFPSILSWSTKRLLLMHGKLNFSIIIFAMFTSEKNVSTPLFKFNHQMLCL